MLPKARTTNISQLFGLSTNTRRILNAGGKIYFSDFKSPNKNDDLRGRPTKIAWLNEPQATFLITLLRNNEIVLDFKSELVDRFYKMRELLLNRQNVQWQELRGQTKAGYKELSAAVHELYEWAVSHGCKAPEKNFLHEFCKAHE